MSNNWNPQSKPTLTKTLMAVVAVIGSMAGLFGAVNTIMSGIGVILGALLVGLVITVVLYQLKFWKIEHAVMTWVAGTVLIFIGSVIISQPTTVTGQIISDTRQPIAGQSLVLTNADGIQQHVVTDQEGYFEVRNVPQGRYTISTNDTGRLLYTGNIPSGWQRVFVPTINTGGLISSLQAIANAPTPQAQESPTNTPIPTDMSTQSPRNTNTPRPTATASATFSPGQELFFEDFEDGEANGFLENTSEGQFGWSVQELESGGFVYEVNRLGISDPLDTSGFGSNHWEDYEIEYEMRVLDSLPGAVGITFRKTANQNGYIVWFSNEYQILGLDRNMNRNWQTIRRATLTLDYNVWYRVRIHVQGSNIEVFINDELMFNASDTSFDTGKIEIWAQNAHVQYDNIIVNAVGD